MNQNNNRLYQFKTRKIKTRIIVYVMVLTVTSGLIGNILNSKLVITESTVPPAVTQLSPPPVNSGDKAIIFEENSSSVPIHKTTGLHSSIANYFNAWKLIEIV